MKKIIACYTETNIHYVETQCIASLQKNEKTTSCNAGTNIRHVETRCIASLQKKNEKITVCYTETNTLHRDVMHYVSTIKK